MRRGNLRDARVLARTLGRLGLPAALAAGPNVRAVDLDGAPAYTPVAPIPAPCPAPSVYADVGPSCRLVPQPQINVFNDVTRYRPIWVCQLRGVYADTFWPYHWPSESRLWFDGRPSLRGG